MIGIFIDGTWQTDTQDNPTNIAKLYDRFDGPKIHFDGPGTGSFWDKYLGGAFGAGVHAIRNKAFKWVMLEIARLGIDTKIVIFGYSRGAAAARMLAAKLANKGIKVEFLGCFDTVGAMGIPVNIMGIPFQKINLFSDFKIHENVLRASHVLANIPQGEAYTATLMEPREGIVQEYFTGNHGYVGSASETLRWMCEQFQN